LETKLVVTGVQTCALPIFIGTEESISSFNRKDLVGYKQETYRASNLVIAAAGNITHEKVVEYAQKYTQQIPTQHTTATHEEEKVITSPHYQLREYYKPIKQAHICLGTFGCGVSDEHRYAVQVLNTVLGDGMSSRLFQNIREKYGFAYAVYSFNNMMKDTGSAGVYIGTDDTHVQQCIDLVWKELKALRKKGITSKELDRTKAQLKGSLMLGMENIPNRMIRLGSSELYFGNLIPLDAISSKIEQVTCAEVQEAAEQIFDENKFTTVIFHPNDKIEPQNEKA
jgi:predicted Zn-dependent peptidase